MRVEVLRVLDAGERVVSFRCEFGVFSAHWMGDQVAHEGEFFVELEVPDEVVEWSQVLDSGSSKIFSDPNDQSAITIVGEVLRVGEDDDPVVDLGVGSFPLMVETLERKSDLAEGQLISFRPRRVEIHPYDL